MTYAAMIVHVDIEENSDKRSRLAVELADRFSAALIGIAGWAPRPALVAEGIVIEAEMTELEMEEMQARLDEAGKKFRADAQHLKHVEWRAEMDFSVNVVAREARAADLVIIGGGRAAGGMHRLLDPGVALLRAGRPVLVVPPAIDSLRADRVVVAWKDTRESRLAVRDALSLLQNAKEVLVVEVCDRGLEAEAQNHVDDVALYLKRHGVVVAAKSFRHAKGSVGAELTRYAHDEKADLLVAGGYGHSRLGEWVFGGVTRDLLAASPICCLLSH